MAEIDLGRVVGDGVLPPDTEMQSTSTNTVQNKVIKKYVDDKAYMHDLAIKMFDDKITDLETKVGDAALNTTAQDLSGAINEHEQNIIDHETKIGAAALSTTAKNLSGAINELNAYESYNLTPTASGITFTGVINFIKVGKLVIATYTGNITPSSAACFTLNQKIPDRFLPTTATFGFSYGISGGFKAPIRWGFYPASSNTSIDKQITIWPGSTGLQEGRCSAIWFTN